MSATGNRPPLGLWTDIEPPRDVTGQPGELIIQAPLLRWDARVPTGDEAVEEGRPEILVEPSRDGAFDAQLPARLGPALTLMHLPGLQLVVMAPVVLREMFENLALFNSLVEAGQDPGRVYGWVTLPSFPWAGAPALLNLSEIASVRMELLGSLGSKAVAHLSDEGLAYLRAHLQAVTVWQP